MFVRMIEPTPNCVLLLPSPQSLTDRTRTHQVELSTQKIPQSFRPVRFATERERAREGEQRRRWGRGAPASASGGGDGVAALRRALAAAACPPCYRRGDLLTSRLVRIDLSFPRSSGGDLALTRLVVLQADLLQADGGLCQNCDRCSSLAFFIVRLSAMAYSILLKMPSHALKLQFLSEGTAGGSHVDLSYISPSLPPGLSILPFRRCYTGHPSTMPNARGKGEASGNCSKKRKLKQVIKD